ncbi:MAG: DUF421 domain-containing protein [Negativicutes bacterium]|nr:DUF421 domain-containing protein [Negativicutes bacterium]
MDQLGVIAFKVLAIMTVLLAVWLAMGKRQLGDFSPFDFAVSITAGTVAGAGIADPRIGLGETVAGLILLGLLQIAVSWISLKYRAFHHRLHHEPTVLVENGQIIKTNLRQVRLTAEMLLQLLREKDVFDITEVELAVLEPHGKLSVLKKAEFLPLTASRMNVTVAPNRILVPVILEGELQEEVLRRMGFGREQMEEWRKQYQSDLNEVFVAFMDKNHDLHVIKDKVQESGTFLH